LFLRHRVGDHIDNVLGVLAALTSCFLLHHVIIIAKTGSEVNRNFVAFLQQKLLKKQAKSR